MNFTIRTLVVVICSILGMRVFFVFLMLSFSSSLIISYLILNYLKTNPRVTSNYTLLTELVPYNCGSSLLVPITMPVIILQGVNNVSSRKYDIEAEAQKLYGEDLAAVLKKFRKTPEYLSILQEKLLDVRKNLDIMVENIHYYYSIKIMDKVKEFIKINDTVDGVNKDVPKYLRDRFKKRLSFTRENEEKENMTAFEKVDSYKKLHSYLTVDERNKMKDIGFEFTGHIIHELIRAMNTDDEFSSTLLPYGADGDKTYSTHDHQVTQEAITETEPAHDLPTMAPDTFRHNKPHNIF